jgi:acyl-CoA synthetase (AMP-forming)/AMP-acid ligase II
MPAGPEIAIIDDLGQPLLAGRKGEIVIHRANVTQGYENNPTANQSAFTPGWFRTGEAGFFDTDGYLFISSRAACTGRLKEIINRGGEKISLREIDDVPIEHPAIAQVVTWQRNCGCASSGCKPPIVFRVTGSPDMRRQAWAMQ